MAVIIRPALPTDAAGIASVLRDLVLAGKRHKRSDPEFALQHYLANPDRIECHIVADDQGMILGFQSLKLAVAGNPYGTPVGWAIIGTHVRPNSVRAGLGKALFSLTLKTAQSAGVPAIEAFIGAKNLEGQAYYDAMGFADYRRVEGAICKSLYLH